MIVDATIMEPEWKAWGKKLAEAFDLKCQPIAVTYTNEGVEGAKDRKIMPCMAMKKASLGETISISSKNSLCPGGSRYLGFKEPTPEERINVSKFVVEKEKFYSTPATMERCRLTSNAEVPFGFAERMILTPLEDSLVQPDIVIFQCNAEQAGRLIHLVNYIEGKALNCDPSCSLCHSAISYPIMRGLVNITFGDIAARKTIGIADSELFVSIPFLQMLGVMFALDKSSAGINKG